MPKGNTTAQRGKKLRRDIRLEPPAREHLRKVWRGRVIKEPGLTEDEIVNQAVMALVDQGSEDWEGEVL